MKGNFANRLFTGLIIISIGVIFLLRQMGYVHFDIRDLFADFWPLILIFSGIRNLLSSCAIGSNNSWWGAIVLIGIGGIFLGRNLDWFSWSIGDIIPYLWPVVVIIAGIHFIWKPRSGRQKPPAEEWKSYRPYADEASVPPAPPLHPDPMITNSDQAEVQFNGQQEAKGPNFAKANDTNRDYGHQGHKKAYREWKNSHKDHVEWWNYDSNAQTRSGFIGDIHIGQDYWELKPLNISHFIGDTVLDLTKAQVASGETKITISSFIGDVKVYVPNDYEIGVQVVSSAFIGDVKILGQKEGGLFTNINIQSPSYTEADKKIKLIVSTFIGDVRVTKVG